MAALRLAGFLLAVVLFARAGIIIRKLRGGYHWTDPRGLQPEYHGANFRDEMRRFLWHLFGGLVVSLGTVLLSMIRPA